MAVERRLMVALLRGQIDAVDAGMRRLLALRRRVVRRIAYTKRDDGVTERDSTREQAMQLRAMRDASRIGLPPGSAQALLTLALAESRAGAGEASSVAASDILPTALLRRLVQRVLRHVLASPLESGALDQLDGRRIGVEIADLGLRWVVTIEQRKLSMLPASTEAEATVRGGVADLLALAGRVEDADSLFFRRRLQLTGDVELGLTVRNLLDRLPWETIPLGLRVALVRGANLTARLSALRHAPR